MCKLFEPILIDIVGEDGKGTTRMSVAGECLQLADKEVDERYISGFHDYTRTSGTTTGRRKGGSTRGPVYFAGLFRLYRCLVTEDGATNDRAVERTQQG
jgi:hypothetical protein